MGQNVQALVIPSDSFELVTTNFIFKFNIMENSFMIYMLNEMRSDISKGNLSIANGHTFPRYIWVFRGSLVLRIRLK